MRKMHLMLPGALLALTGSAFAQGDDCGTATAVGLGNFTFDTTANGTSGFDGGGGCGLGSDDLGPDAFWQVTVTAAGDYAFDTLGSSYDTKLSVHAGTGCAAICVGYNDDEPNGTLQSEVRILGASAGDTFLVQVGGFAGAAGTGVLNVATYVDPCTGIPDDSFEDNDDCTMTTTLAVGSYTGLHVVNGDDDFYEVTIPAGEQVVWTEVFDSNDVTYDVWDTGCGTQLLIDQLNGFTYSNITGAPETVVIQAYNWPGAALGCTDYDIDVFLQPDPCATVVPDAFEDNDDCSTPNVLTTGSYTGLNVQNGDPDYYEFTIPAGEVLTVFETFDTNDTVWSLWDAGCGTVYLQFFFDTLTYTNTTGAPETVIIQVENWMGAAQGCGDYDFDISTAPDPCASATDDGFEENDDCSMATAIGDGTYPGLFAVVGDKDHYAFCIADGATVTIDIINDLSGGGDIDANLWDALDINCGGGFGAGALVEGFSFGDEFLTYTNTTGAELAVVLEVNNWDDPSVATCNNYDMTISGALDCGDGTGTPFCNPMDMNSTGASTTLTGSFASGVGSDLHLEATDGPSGEFGYFLVGNAFSEPGITISNGRLCLDPLNGNQVGRYNFTMTDRNSVGQFDGSGVLQNIVGTSAVGSGFDVPTQLPITGNPSIMAGETWHFQCWHRDTPAGVGQSNFSNGLSVNF